MNPARAALVAILAVATACDSPLASRRTASHVEVTPGYVHLPVGESARLEVAARDRNGARLNGDLAVRWTSSDTTVVSVSSAGVVRARSDGVATVAASIDRAVGAATVSVAVPAPTTCDTALRLDVGQVYAAAPGGAGTLCLEAGPQDAEFTLIPFHGPRDPGGALPIEIALSGTSAPRQIAGAAGRAAAATARQAPPVRPGKDAWERRLRERELRQLGPRLGADAVPDARAVPTTGTRLTLNVNAEQACVQPMLRTGEVVAVSDHAIVVADLANPHGGFSPEEYEEIAGEFDRLVFPVVTNHFGAVSDVDGNGRVMIFFTEAVNRVGSADDIVGGFFFSRDLLPQVEAPGQRGCEGSNHAELLYLMVPDPARAAAQPAFAKTSVRRNVTAVMAHELQHLVNAAQRLVIQRSGGSEEVWLNEGLSHLAEELVGYHAAGLQPGQNLHWEGVRGSEPGWQQFNRFHRSNFGRLEAHLMAPAAAGVFDATLSRAGRGAAWQFLRYAADRRGGDQRDLWRSLVRGPETGLRNLDHAFGVDIRLWLRDWTVAAYVDDTIPDLDPAWSMPSWNFRSIFGGLRGDGSFPLAPQRLGPGGETTVQLAPGGAAYLEITVPAATRGVVRTTWNGGLTPPHSVFLSVVRTR